ncbi:hypothetical protein Smp_185080, partial [Schistosoma mansoni]|uniref:hypothetical protein n=1 Tax=Schistosoma mansoni TaxID=6183 RepID=UPI00022DC527
IPPISPLSQVHISNTTPYHNTFNYKHYNQRKNTTITTIQTNIHTQTLICMLRMDMDMQTIYHKQTKHQTPILQQHHHHHQQQQQSYTLQTNGVLSSNPTKHKHLVVGVRGIQSPNTISRDRLIKTRLGVIVGERVDEHFNVRLFVDAKWYMRRSQTNRSC